ncbi:coenzyme F420-0:L-glutamate ligase [Subtercola endophyticus]|uniref:coenzyme F420-0:L-glutamate ligase n=1 Tax=Subtercola endophyticus TaxID=2895559 RepID=UPI0036F1B59B
MSSAAMCSRSCAADMGAASLEVYAVDGIPEIEAGVSLAGLIGDAVEASGLTLVDGDILVVTSKIVSKAEGRSVRADDREAAITAETVRVVATRAHPGGVTRIVENRQGIVQAAAGVDASNTPAGTVLLLPLDPDASARALAAELRTRFGVRLGILISDTLGRAWREGQTDAAIGSAGVTVVDDLRGGVDTFGTTLEVTQISVADELAAAADLVKGKATGVPVALVRGAGRFVVESLDTPARALNRTGPTDMFRLGTDEALELGRAEGFASGYEAGLAAAGAAAAATAGAAAAGDAGDPAAGVAGSDASAAAAGVAAAAAATGFAGSDAPAAAGSDAPAATGVTGTAAAGPDVAAGSDAAAAVAGTA